MGVMCRRTKEEIQQLIENLPKEPEGLILMQKPGDFHGVLDWEVTKGRMISFPIFDNTNCEIFHTRFSPGTIINWHSHGELSDEIIICLSGSLNVIFDTGQEFILKESNYMIIEKKINHMAIISDKPTEIIAMTIPKENGG